MTDEPIAYLATSFNFSLKVPKQNGYIENMPLPDKPLFYQGKWWFISENRELFYWIDKDDWIWSYYLLGEY